MQEKLAQVDEVREDVVLQEVEIILLWTKNQRIKKVKQEKKRHNGICNICNKMLKLWVADICL